MKILKWLDLHFEEIFLTICLVILTCLILANVVLRYIFGSGISWGEAVCRYCLVYSCFFSIAHWIRRSNGISVDAVVTILPENAKQILHWIVRILMIAFFGILLQSSFTVLRSVGLSGMSDGIMGFSMSYIYVACCIGFLDALLRSVQVLILDIKDLTKEG